MKNKISCMIPMRHNSERVPGKNYRKFGDKPLFMHILETIHELEVVDEILINTDSPEIEKISGASFKKLKIIPRPKNLIDGSIPMNEIIKYDLENTKNEHILQTHSTNPLLSQDTLIRAVNLYFKQLNEYDSLFSVTARQSRFYDEKRNPINHNPAKLERTQDLSPLLEENYCIYLFSKTSFRLTNNRIGLKSNVLQMNEIESLDIDNEIDFNIAETIYLKSNE